MRTTESSRRRHGPIYAVLFTILVAFVLYAALARAVGSPRFFSDELLYFETGASLAAGEGPIIRGEPYRYSPLYPGLLAAMHSLAHDRVLGYELATLLNALLFSLTAVPVFLLARRLLPPWPSAVAAALSVLVPSSMYVSVVMTESLAYFAGTCALYAIFRAVERPTPVWQLVSLGSIGVAAAARMQLVILALVYLLSLAVALQVLPARRQSLGSVLRSLWPTGGALLLCLIAATVVPYVLNWNPPGEQFTAYSTLWRSYDVLEVGRWVVYQFGNLALYLAVVPVVVAPIVLARLLARARRGGEAHGAFLALFCSANAVFLVVVAAFNSTEWAGDRVHDRPIFYVVPLWLILLVTWIVLGAPRTVIAAAIGASLTAMLAALLPYSDLARDDALLQFSAVTTTLWAAVEQAGGDGSGSTRLVLMTFVILASVAALAIPASRSGLLVPIVASVLVITAALSWHNAVRSAAPWREALRPDERMWLDEAVPDGSAAMLLVTRATCTDPMEGRGFYLTEFFNDSASSVAVIGRRPDLLPRIVASVGSEGRLELPSGDPLQADYVVAQPGIELHGEVIARGTAARLAVWRVDGPVRALAATSDRQLVLEACRGRGRRDVEHSATD